MASHARMVHVIDPETSTRDGAYCSMAQAAERLGVSRVTIWRWVRDGRLPVARLGHRTVRIKSDDLEKLVAGGRADGHGAWPTGASAPGRPEATPGATRADWWAIGDGEHLVEFHETDAFLLDAVCDFIGAALRAGDAGIVVATPAHRAGLEGELAAHGLDLTAARAEGRYLALDAAATLQTFTIDGEPQPGRFAEVLGDIVARAAEGGRRVRVFGEMVALLLAEGNPAAALRLEGLWNDLQRSSRFSLLCAYPLEILAAEALDGFVDGVCAEHSRIIPAESYTALDGPADRLRVVAVLQQKARALEADVAARKRAEERLRFLAEASKALASSLDYAATVARVAELVVPSLADWCVVDVVEAGGHPRRVATAHADPAKLAWVRQLQERYPPEWHAPSGVAKVLRTGRAEVYPDLPDELLRSSARDPEHLQLLRDLGLTSAIIAPIEARGTTFGAITLISAESGRRYGASDLALAEDLAHHAALAIDNAWLHRDLEEQVAVHVQLNAALRDLAEERDRARQEIEAAHARLAAVLDQMPSGVIIAEAPSSRLILGNARVERIWGRSFLATAAAGEDGRPRGFHPDGRPYRPEEWPLARSLTTGEVVTGEEIAIEREDGTRAWIRASAGPVRDLQGNLVAGVLTVDDVTASKQAERAAAHLAAIVTSSADAVVSKTLDGIVTSWNASAERMFGYTAEEMIGQSIRRIIPPERSDEEDRILARLRAGERIEHFETVRMAKDGRRLDVSLTISPVRDSAGTIIGASKIARDITARRQIEAERDALLATTQEAVRGRDELLALVSHDLKNPLAAIRGHAQFLQRLVARLDSPNGQRIGEGLGTIEQATRKMQALVEELLDHARLQAGEPLLLERRPVDLVALARRIAQEQQRATTRHRIRVEPDRTELIGQLDAARLERVVENLLTNAIKYSPGGGEIAVRLAREEDNKGARAVLAVRDEGIGIPAADLPRVFERFYRASNAASQVRGTGLGLAGVRQIVEEHGGTIEVVSTEGRGSTFTVRLPLGEEGPARHVDAGN